MKRLIAAVTAVAAGCLGAFADTYDEKLDYIDTTGTQWVDTGILPKALTTRVRARVAVLERPASTVALFGTARHPNPAAWDGSWITAWTGMLNADMFFSYWTGSDGGGYRYPESGQYAANSPITIEGFLGSAWYNGGKTGGHYDVPGGKNGYHYTDNPQYAYVEGQSFYVGNANDSTGALLTEPGSAPKIRWYSFSIEIDDEVVCNLIPVKKGGVAGFFDTVTETFLPSRSEDAFVEPQYFTWKGGGDTEAWDDGSNWEGGVAPGCNCVRIPNNCTAIVRQPDTAYVSKFGTILLDGADATLSFSNLTAAVTFNVPIKGTGHFRVEQDASYASTELRLSMGSDNSAFTGDFTITNAGLRVKNAKGLGTSGNRVNAYITGSERVYFSFTGTCTSEFYLKCGGYSCAYMTEAFCSPVLTGDVHALGLLILRGYDAANRLTLDGQIVRDVSAELDLNTGLTLTHDGLDLSTKSATVFMGSDKKFGGYVKSLGTCYSDGSVEFIAPNVLNAAYGNTWQMGNNGYSYTFDLGGFDQRIGTMRWKPATGSQPSAVITSTKGPATLTICSNIRNDSLANTFCGRVRGEATIELNSTNSATAGSAKFAFGASETTGGLLCRRGTLTVESTASFSNLTALVVSGEGKMVLNTSDIGNATNLCVAVTNAPADGALTLADGVALLADTMVIKTDRWLDAGVYGGPDSAAPNKLTCLAGTGTITVNRYGGPKGFLLLVR